METVQLWLKPGILTLLYEQRYSLEMVMSEDEYIGLVLNEKYQLTELLGKGGMGAVYRGRHIIIGKTVAVKFLHAEFASNKEVVKRFYREAQTAAAIGHDNIIDVMDVGISHKNEPYLVMEFLEGENLGDMLARTGPLSIEAAAGVMEPVLLALNVAHEKGIVHRDLKPDNIFLVHRVGESPKIKLIDFGISKFSESVQQNEKLTRTGSVMGTPSYMSPEQARGDSKLDHRADLFSVGVILYEMLTGKLPFTGDNFTSIIVNILTLEPVPPEDAYPSFPEPAGPVLQKALMKDPNVRYQTALEFLDDLKQIGDYARRTDALTQLAAGITHKTFAGGSLGTESVDGDSSVASEILSQVIRQATPAGWAGTTPGHTRSMKSIVVPLVLMLLVIGVSAVAAILFFRQKDQPAPQIVPVQALPAPGKMDESVEILVEGAPIEAKIFYNNTEVTSNPFRVQKGEALVPLRVEAAGYMTTNLSVVPKMSRTLQVAMQKVAETEEDQAARRSDKRRGRKRKRTTESLTIPKPTFAEPAAKVVVVPEEPPPPPPPSTTQPKPAPQKKNLIKGARGTKMQTEFE